MRTARVPGPRGRWLVGDMDAYVADRIGWLSASRHRYGDLVRITPDTVVTHDPETAHRILATTNETYMLETGQLGGRRRRAEAMARLGRWMAVRRNIWHGFADTLTASHLARLGARAVELLDEHAGPDGDLVRACRMLTGRLIIDFCLGGEPERSDLRSEVARRANRLFERSLSVLTDGESRRRLWRRPLAAAATEADADLRALLADLVARRRAERPPDEPRDLLDTLTAGTGRDEDDMVVSVLRMAMFASHGVPGAALSWVVLRLASEPAALAAVRAEATDRATDPANLPVTTAVVREVLRLHPPQWLLSRTALRDTDIDGYPVRSGHQVLVCPYLLHRDERFWPRPGEFDHTRWLGGQTPHPPHTYLPFGAGPRICPGSGLALSQLTLLAAVLARAYTLRVPPVDRVATTCDGLLLPAVEHGGWEGSG